jgi:hypothetical protein
MFAGARPQLGKGTLIYLPVTSGRAFSKEKSKWDSRTLSSDTHSVQVQIRMPSQVAVGVWKLRVSSKQLGQKQIKSFDVKNNIYVLFNAWSKGESSLFFSPLSYQLPLT